MIFKLDWTQLSYYNAEDLTRVESNVQSVADLLEEMAYIPELQAVKDDWNMQNLPTLTQINRIESNIDALRQSFYTPVGWEDRKTWIIGMKFNWEDALRFERNLNLLQQLIGLVKDSMKYAGTFVSGQEVIL
ncbi:MAG TPA: hypothetical protein DHU59_13525 [Clostridiales bacterium]|nr:hypothetical protein [Clostridiales bacterium]